jgi:hypothetical protein
MVKVVFIEHFKIQRKFVKPVYADMFKFHDAPILTNGGQFVRLCPT